MADTLGQIPNIRKRQDGKLASTTFVNEVADAIRGMATLPTTGTPQFSGQFLGGVPFKVYTNRSGSGQYDGLAGAWQYNLVNSGILSLASVADFVNTGTLGVLINQGESGKSTHYIGENAIVQAFPTGTYTDDDPPLPVYITNFTHALRDIRYDLPTHSLQYTFDGSDVVPEANWITFLTFDACDTTIAPASTMDFAVSQSLYAATRPPVIGQFELVFGRRS